MLYQLSKAHEMTGEYRRGPGGLQELSTGYPELGAFCRGPVPCRGKPLQRRSLRPGGAGLPVGHRSAATRPYFLNALYMHGWSQFKQGRYRQSIRSIPRPWTAGAGDNKLDGLSAADRALVADSSGSWPSYSATWRVWTPSPAAYAQLGQRSYQPLLYRELGELYLSQERYRDSAETFRAFSRRYPASEFAHRFHVRVIGIYQKGRLPRPDHRGKAGLRGELRCRRRVTS